MLKTFCISLKINIVNVNIIPLTQPYDVVMMYWNYIKKELKK